MKRSDRPVLVTGASGYVGRALVPHLRNAGIPVRALVRDAKKGRRLMDSGAELQVGDLLDPPTLARSVRGCSAVIHLAAIAYSSDVALNRRVNVEGSRNLAKACRDAGVARVINFSSTCAGRSQQDAYGRSKREAEAEFEGPEVTHLRPTMIYGRGSEEFERFARIVAAAPRVPIPGDGKSILQPVALDDLLALVGRVLNSPNTIGKTYDVAGPVPIGVDHLVEATARAQGKTAKVVHIPGALCLFGARVLGRLLPHPPINVDQVLAFLQDTHVDIGPARRDLAFDPRPLEEGLAEVLGVP